jgi:hypothetical protein
MQESGYWRQQLLEQPLFPDLIWSRPENKTQAGKLLIIGGSGSGFSKVAEAYSQALKAGLGAAKILLPDSLQKTVGPSLTAGQYAPSTPSGSFSRSALGEALAASDWADAVLLAGDFGHNSETAIFLESLVSKYDGPLGLAGDSLDYFIKSPVSLLARENTLLILEFNQLQKISSSAHFSSAFTSNMDLIRFVEAIHLLTSAYKPALVTEHLNNLAVSFGGQVITTKVGDNGPGITMPLAAKASVWWLQNINQPLDGLASSLVAES